MKPDPALNWLLGVASACFLLMALAFVWAGGCGVEVGCESKPAAAAAVEPELDLVYCRHPSDKDPACLSVHQTLGGCVAATEPGQTCQVVEVGR